MRFELDDLHASIQQNAREFAQKEVRPQAVCWDQAEEMSTQIVKKVGDMGFWGIRLPEEYGGAGLDTLAYSIVVEEIGREDGSLGLSVAAHNGLGSSHIATFGSEELKKKYLPKLASGEYLGAWALTEPSSGSDAAGSMQTRAIKQDKQWLLNGSKQFITHGASAGVCVVMAVTDPSKKQKGITAFAVEKGTPGFTVSQHLKKLGMRACETVELSLENVALDDSQRVGELNSGFIDTLKILDTGRISIASLALGLGEGALQRAISYAKEREQFGKTIANFQAIQWMIANSRTKLDAARLLTWKAASLADQGKPYTNEAAMAKLYASEAATEACNHAIQIHGGYGYTREYVVERHLRDAKLCEIGEGTSEVQRMVIAKNILRK
ncbi:MAG: acyl-CoA dehydrogenase family protein [Myxococcales bacterium]|nr:MAG: acyl-CoA dehydrogenase family protein [Myxococcales bacterium]